VGAVKGMKLRGTSNKWLATAMEVGRVGRRQPVATWLYALAHSVLMGFLPRP